MKSPTTKLQKKCDSYLTPIIKLKTPRCEVCGSPTSVAHHWIEKSRSSRLRYDFENLIALCLSCHSKIHNTFGNNIIGGIDIAQVIINKRGQEWHERMKTTGRELIKVNKQLYERTKEKLEAELHLLSSGIDY